MSQIFKYNLKQLLHDRGGLFWIILFPIILGTFFKAAFSNITAGEQFQEIPVAIVNEQGTMSDGFMETVKELDKEGENRFLKAIYCDKKQALSLLKKEKVDGIIQVKDSISLTVSSDMSSAKLNQSILSAFIEEYQMNYQAIEKIIKTTPEKLPEALDILQENTAYNKEVSYGKNADTYDQYFYNLLAMVSMYCGTAGCLIAIHNQGNLSAIGARKNVSPTHKMKDITGELAANVLFRFVCILISFAFIVLVLGIPLHTRLPFALLAIFAGCLTGMTFGFFIGAIGNMNENVKTGIVMVVTMTGSFLSGLMAGNMRIIVDTYCPIINRINPTALISDMFYSLAIYDSLDRYFENLITLIILSALFCIGGFLLTRRKKYANI